MISRREALQRVAFLLGGAISAPTIAAVLAGCGDRRREAGSYDPRALSAEQNEMVASISEHIIPRTDTPGAREARVNEFVDVMLAEYYPAGERQQFLAGLAQVNQRSQQAYGTRYLDATPEQQRQLVALLDREAFQPQPPEKRPAAQVDVRERFDGTASENTLPPQLQADSIRWRRIGPAPRASAELPFFRTMKELTLAGYYTSEVGATEELRHAPTPGRYEGCIPFSEVGRTWAV